MNKKTFKFKIFNIIIFVCTRFHFQVTDTTKPKTMGNPISKFEIDPIDCDLESMRPQSLQTGLCPSRFFEKANGASMALNIGQFDTIGDKKMSPHFVLGFGSKTAPNMSTPIFKSTPIDSIKKYIRALIGTNGTPNEPISTRRYPSNIEQTLLFCSMLLKKFNDDSAALNEYLEYMLGYTFLFEQIEHRHLVFNGEETPGLVLLAIRKGLHGKYSLLSEIGKQFTAHFTQIGITIPSSCDELPKNMSYKEGYVKYVDGSPVQKLKSVWYDAMKWFLRDSLLPELMTATDLTHFDDIDKWYTDAVTNSIHGLKKTVTTDDHKARGLIDNILKKRGFVSNNDRKINRPIIIAELLQPWLHEWHCADLRLFAQTLVLAKKNGVLDKYTRQGRRGPRFLIPIGILRWFVTQTGESVVTEPTELEKIFTNASVHYTKIQSGYVDETVTKMLDDQKFEQPEDTYPNNVLSAFSSQRSPKKRQKFMSEVWPDLFDSFESKNFSMITSAGPVYTDSTTKASYRRKLVNVQPSGHDDKMFAAMKKQNPELCELMTRGGFWWIVERQEAKGSPWECFSKYYSFGFAKFNEKEE